MSVEQNIKDNTSNKEVLSDKSKKISGDIYVQDVHKYFGITKALNGVNFNANFGEIHAIVGGNGCGKSTLAKVMSGVLPVDKGKVSVMGHTPTSPVMAREMGIATVFQEVMIAEEATVVDNLFVGSDSFWYKNLTQREKALKAQELMEDLSGEYIDPYTQVFNLSLPIKAWITIGRAFLRENTKVLILDESSAALDFDSTERLFKKMRELRDNGVAVFIVTHRIAELIRISDKATVMRDGKDVGVLEKKDLNEKNLLSLMTGRTESGDKSKSTAVKTKTDKVVMRAENLVVWPESVPVNFEVRRGEIVGVTGLDGNGQDDFVKILAGVQESHGGTTEVLDSSDKFTKYNSLMDAKKNGVSFVSGDRKKEGILPNLSIYENLVVPLYRTTSKAGWLGFINWLELNGVFDWEVERLNIKTGPKDNLIGSLSGGNQQKVMIARSLATHPKILILNDPARGIDVSTKRDLYTHLRNFVEEGNTVIFLSSELEEFIDLCPKVLVFRHGTIFDIFENEKVNADTLLEGMFGQTAGIGSTNISRPNNKNILNKPSKDNNYKTNVNNLNKKIIKIENFEKEKKSKSKNLNKKIKIKTF
ncbi:MAG: sugar ABC transporter ATP-binding protein [Candidatus Pelagibacterales bacterium]|nr:MAG: sugar ABC transporter ATP-binding protein [Pelagibacterales bacterium]